MEGGSLDRDLLNYLSNETNVVKVNAIISREKTDKGIEYIHVTVGEKEIYTFWNNPSKSKEATPKNTGGKKPYVMLMVQKMAELQKSGIKNIEENIGFLVLLSENIEWNTGRVIHKRSKKSLKYLDLQEIYTSGKYKFEKIMKSLSDNKLMKYKEDGYYISSELIKKGAKK